jgi:D-sedoheptulose 7-phosphate isomerase
MSIIQSHIRESIAVLEAFGKDTNIMLAVERAGQICADAIKGGSKILLAGNGGSAADSQHIAAEFVSRLSADRDPLPALALTTDSSVLTAIGNDYGFESVFARQLKAVGKSGDVFIAISTSGRSPNIIKALNVAAEMQLKTIGLTGVGGGDIPALADICIRVPSDVTAYIQQVHIVVGHLLCAIAEREYLPQRYEQRAKAKIAALI